MFSKSPVKHDVFFDELPVISGSHLSDITSLKNKKEYLISKVNDALEYLIYKSGVFTGLLVAKYPLKYNDEFQSTISSYKKILKNYKSEISTCESLNDVHNLHNFFYKDIINNFKTEHLVLEINVFMLGLSNHLQSINLAFVKKLT